MAAATTVVLAIAVALAYRDNSRNDDAPGPQPAPQVETSGEIDPFAALTDPSVLSAERPVYKYSVIPGGAYSEKELRSALAIDTVAAKHYKDLDRSRLRTETVARDRYVHVSYRKGNEVFWTKKKVLLRQGETILTDGRTQVRARCGNCISEQPLGATGDQEPDVIEFDRLVDDLGNESSNVVSGLPAKTGNSAAGTALAAFPLLGGSSGPVGGGGAASPLAGGGSGAGAPLARATRNGQDEPRAPGSPGGASPSGSASPGPDVLLPPGDFLGPYDNPLPPVETLVPPGTGNPGPENPGGPVGLPGSPADVPTNPVPAPEPGTLLLLSGGVAELVRRRLRSPAR